MFLSFPVRIVETSQSLLKARTDWQMSTAPTLSRVRPSVRASKTGLATPATQERFVRMPVRMPPQQPSHENYSSPFEEDVSFTSLTRFGAKTDANSCKQTGSSQANPEYTPRDMQKAVRWPKGFADVADCLETVTDPTGVLSDDESDQLPEHWRQQERTLWPRKEVIYTDGSARDTGRPDYYRSGTGIFRFESRCGFRIELQIDPIDYHIGVANTIQRAELVGIYKALSIDHAGSDLLLCTDSLSSMYMIDKHMRCPSLHKECKHEELLTLIVEALAAKAREGVHVQLVKVKSHIGTEGNEMADKLAHDACVPNGCNDKVADGVDIRENIYWPHFAGRKIHNSSGGAAAIVLAGARGVQLPSQTSTDQDGTSSQNASQDDTLGDFQVNDMRKGLKTLLKSECAQGFSNNTVYVLAWLSATTYILGDMSNSFWNAPTITSSMITMLLKYRFGQLWKLKIAFRQQRPYLPGMQVPRSEKCPHCGSPDSGGHILGGCTRFTDIYISRHDASLRMLLKAIVKGAHGGYYTIADIGRDELTLDLGVDSKRIPTWLLPDSALAEAGIEPSHRHRLRPDIMFAEMGNTERLRYTADTTAGLVLPSTI